MDSALSHSISTRRIHPSRPNCPPSKCISLLSKSRSPPLSQIDLENSSECTFSPKTNRAGGKIRNKEEFYNDMDKFSKLRISKIEAMRNQLRTGEESYTFMPAICEKSAQILQQKSQVGPKRRRRVQSSEGSFSVNTQLTEERMDFVPRVNRLSKEMIRGQPVETILYGDAMRRQKKKTPQTNTRVFSPSA